MCIAVNVQPDMSVLEKKWYVIAYVMIHAEGGIFVAKADSAAFADRIVAEHNHSLEVEAN